MVSIRKYLDMRGDQTNKGGTALSGFCVALLTNLCAAVVTGETGAELRVRLEEAAEEISGAGDTFDEESAARLEVSVRSALALHSARQRETAQRLAVETQHVVGVLNHALMALVSGGERTDSRLRRIQDSLSRTARINDPVALRASLGDAMKLIQEEGWREKETAERELQGFEAEMARFRENAAANPARLLSDRAGAIRYLNDTLQLLDPGLALCMVAFSLDNFRPIVNRYGPEPVGDIFLQLVRERIQPLAAASSAWQWSPSCVVGTFTKACTLDELKSQVARLNREPLVHHMRIGGRSAVLRVNLSCLPLIASPDPGAIEQLDRFSGVVV